MAELKKQGRVQNEEPGLDRNLERLDEDLNIMERHAAQLVQMEDTIKEDMRKWDREYKDATLHSVPRPRKHIR